MFVDTINLGNCIISGSNISHKSSNFEQCLVLIVIDREVYSMIIDFHNDEPPAYISQLCYFFIKPILNISIRNSRKQAKKFKNPRDI